MPFFARTESPLGALLMVSDGRALAGVYFVGQKYQAQPALDWHEDPELPVLKRAGVQLHEYFGGRRHEFDLPLSPAGTQFQQRVWRALRSIPYGVTRSYGALAQSIGAPRSVRAVGAAIGRNPISIVIPCHRVVGGDGSLTGYAGGLARKQALLDLETAQVRNRRGGSRTTETEFSTAQT
jgi:methylated-DNA-[protein]-cysteine S-methyltransferase